MAPHNAGLTLIELMVTLAVAITLFAIGVPLFQNITTSNARTAETNALVAALNQARSEAVKLGTPVTVCSKADPLQTDPGAMACGAANEWTNGWFVFADVNGSATFENATENVIRAWTQRTGGVVIPAAPAAVTYAVSGELQGAANATFTLYVKECPAATEGMTQLIVNSVGRLNTDKVTCP